MATRSVICFGEALIDFYGAEQAALVDVGRFDKRMGGAPLNVAVGLARFGGSAALVSRVGRDPFGAFICAALAAEGVDARFVVETDARTGLAFVETYADGSERGFVFYRQQTADTEICSADVVRAGDAIRNAALIHFCGNGMALPSMAAATETLVSIATEAQVPCSFDLNLRPHFWSSVEAARDAALAMVPRVQLLKASLDEARLLTGASSAQAACQQLAAMGPKVVAVTLGEQGAVWATATQQGRVPSIAVDLVDPIGAGDGFCAGWITALLPDLGDLDRLSADALNHAVSRGCQAGAEVCRHLGAT